MRRKGVICPVVIQRPLLKLAHAADSFKNTWNENQYTLNNRQCSELAGPRLDTDRCGETGTKSYSSSARLLLAALPSPVHIHLSSPDQVDRGVRLHQKALS